MQQDNFQKAMSFHQQGQLAQAKNLYESFLKSQPNHADCLHLLGLIALQSKDYQRAADLIGKAIRSNHKNPVYFINQGIALRELKELEAAIASYNRAIALLPNSAAAYYSRGNAQKELRQVDESMASYRMAMTLQPDHTDAILSLGDLLHGLNRWQESIALYERLIALRPDHAEAHCNLGRAQFDMGDVDKAEQSFRRALQLNPKSAHAHNNLALLLLNRGDIGLAMQSFRAALACDASRSDAYTGLLYCLNSDETLDPKVLFAEQLGFGEQYESALRPGWAPHKNTREKQRVLQIGFVSGDFLKSAAASFIEPMLQVLCKSPHFSLHAYYNHTVQDYVTLRLKGCFTHWNTVADKTDLELANQIRHDGIDILIDLSGHTARNRLLTFAHKPAPIQVTWIGFPGTTGLQGMDYNFTDQFFLPPGHFDAQFTEKLVYLPSAVCFLPEHDAPPVNALPALTKGHFTFGSFNRRNKMNPAVIALWARVLHAVPDARMVIGGIENGQDANLVQRFAHERITAQRLQFLPRSGMDAYLSQHNEIDLCLDTFPYTGLTTSMHALWMGVPTLSLSGSTPIARQGSLIAGHMKLPDLLAGDTQQFVDMAVKWTHSLETLSQIRASLRERLLSTPLGNPSIQVAGLECAFRTIWIRWCEGRPTESFESVSGC